MLFKKRPNRLKQQQSAHLHMEYLEPRMLLSADSFGAAIGTEVLSSTLGKSAILDLDDANAVSTMVQAMSMSLMVEDERHTSTDFFPEPINLTALTQDHEVETDLPLSFSSFPSDNIRTEILIVDETVQDYQLLISELTSASESIEYEILILSKEGSGIEQVSDFLAQRSGIDALHFISHGNDETVYLGNSSLNNATIGSFSQSIIGWQRTLSTDADILFYGCNIAASSDGIALIDAMAELTGADVAASDDLTGAAQLGGDWLLEYSTGALETNIAVNAETQLSWSNILGSITVTTFNDVVDGDADLSSLANLFLTPGADTFVSLREAITAANNDSGVFDTITLNAGTYITSIDIAGDDDTNVEGDLDINDALAINGVTAATTVIDGFNVLERVFDVHSVNVTMSNLSIILGGSNLELGGGLRVDAGADLNLTDVIFSNNFSQDGGGIYNVGTLTLNQVEFNNNLNTENDGGAIYNNGGIVTATDTIFNNNQTSENASNGGAIYNNVGTITLTDSIFSNNLAENNGGAIYNNVGNITLTRVDFTANSASGGGGGQGDGGAIYNLGGTVTGTDVVFSGNYADMFGGAIYNTGVVTLDKILFVDNEAKKESGGAIYNSVGTVTLENATLSANFAKFGGAIHNENTGTLNLTSSTLTGNYATEFLGVNGILQDATSTLNIKNTLLNDGVGNVFGGIVNSQGYNIDSDGSGLDKDFLQPFTNTGDQVGTLGTPLDTLLDVLADNGGFSQTHALLTGSVAINAGSAAPLTDQRGILRNTLSPSIGAFEGVSVNALLISTNGNATDNNAASFNDNDIAVFKNPDLAFELGDGSSGTTDGTFSTLYTLPENVRGFHYVTTPVTVDTLVGTVAGTYNLQAGQIVLTLRDAATVDAVGGGTLNVNNTDLLVYTVFTDEYELLLEDAILKTDLSPANIHAVTIVEANTMVGVDTVLTAGTYILAGSDPLIHANIITYNDATGAQDLLLGADFLDDASKQIQGLEFIENATTVNGAILNVGTLLVTTETALNFGTTGQTQVLAEEVDIVALTINATQQDSTPTTNVDAQIFFDGSDIALSVSGGGEINGFSLQGNSIAPVLSVNSMTLSQGEVVVIDATNFSATDIDSTDGNLIFTVSSVSNGFFAFSADLTTAITSFIQDDVTAGTVRFVHDGGELAPAYDVTVSDLGLNSPTSAATINFSNTSEGVLWLSLNGDEGTGSGIPGLNTVALEDDDVLQMANPNFSLGPAGSVGTDGIDGTDGTFSLAFNASVFAGNENINGMHFVSSTTTIGMTNAITLLAGDLILSSGSAATFSSNGVGAPLDLVVTAESVFYFRPDTPGDYTVGNFYTLLSDPFQDGSNIRGLTLVEQTIILPDYTLNAGDFLFATPASDNDIWLMQTSTIDPTSGITYPTILKLIEGDDAGVDIEDRISGLDILEENMTLGGQSYNVGTILLTLDGNDTDGLGTNLQLVDDVDIAALTVANTTLGSGATNAVVSTSLFFDGDDVSDNDVNFDSGNEKIDALTLTAAFTATINQAPTISPLNPVFINEIHYDNDGIDTGEAIEIMGLAGTDLTGWNLVLYNGATGLLYDTEPLSGIIADQSNGYGTLVFNFPVDGIQNATDGIALVNASSTVIQFLSYEGVVTAIDGAATGMTSIDIGVAESGTTLVGDSLQLSGTGSDYSWTSESASTFGSLNTGQTVFAVDSGTEDTDNIYTHAQMLTLLGATDIDDADANLTINITNVMNSTIVLSGGTGELGTTFTFQHDSDFNGQVTFDFPEDSRAVKDGRYLNTDQINRQLVKIKALNEIAKNRNQSLAQMAISWILKDERITSVLIGASKTEQILDSLKAIENTVFSDEELTLIDKISE